HLCRTGPAAHRIVHLPRTHFLAKRLGCCLLPRRSLSPLAVILGQTPNSTAQDCGCSSEFGVCPQNLGATFPGPKHQARQTAAKQHQGSRLGNARYTATFDTASSVSDWTSIPGCAGQNIGAEVNGRTAA